MIDNLKIKAMLQFCLNKRIKHQHRLDFENNPDLLKAYQQGFIDGIMNLFSIFSIFIHDLKKHLNNQYREIENEEYNKTLGKFYKEGEKGE